MKKFIWIPLVFISCGLWAQTTQTATVSDLYISNAPGLILAGKSTTTVDRPTTPRAFAIDLVNLAQGGAVETTPYWWFRHPNYTYSDYINHPFVFLQTLNISLANFKTDSNFTLAPGIRATVFRLYTKSSRKVLEAKRLELVQAIVDLDTAQIAKLLPQLSQLAMRGYFDIEVAAASLATSDGSPFKDLEFNRYGVWSNVSYNSLKLPLGFVGMARYSWGNGSTSTVIPSGKYLDFGGQVNYTADPFSFSAEYVNRRDIALKKNYYKLSGEASYNITKNIALVASYGKDLKPGNGMIALFGINFGVSQSAVKVK